MQLMKAEENDLYRESCRELLLILISTVTLDVPRKKIATSAERRSRFKRRVKIILYATSEEAAGRKIT